VDAVAHLAHLIEVESRECCIQYCHEYADVIVRILLLIRSKPDHTRLMEEMLVSKDEYAEESTTDGHHLHARYYFIIEEVAGECRHEHLCHHYGDGH